MHDAGRFPVVRLSNRRHRLSICFEGVFEKKREERCGGGGRDGR